MPKPKKIRPAIFFILILVVAAGALYAAYGKEKEDKNKLYLYGNVDIRQTQLAFYDSGRIQQVHVEEGDAVTAGLVLAEIDPTRFQAEVALAEANVMAKEHLLARLEAGSRPEDITAAEARVKSAEAVLIEARNTFERAKKLAHTQFVSEQHLDTAQAAQDSAEARLKAEKQALILARKGPRQEDIDAAKANLAAANAKLKLARERLEDTKLRASASGIIQERILEPGEMVFPQRPVLTVALQNPIWVRAYVPEKVLGKIAPGMPAQVMTDSYPDKQYAGWIGYISPTAEFTPKSVETTELRTELVYQVRVFVCNPRNELRLGMPATVVIDLQSSPAEATQTQRQPCQEASHGGQ